MVRIFGALTLSLVAASAAPAQVVGWRTDGTGKYPSATPVTEWSPTKNVVWKTKMPSWSNSTPVLVGDRIFVCSEPATLVCLRASNGRILWQKSNIYDDFLTPAEKARAKEDARKARLITAKMQPIQKKLRTAQRALRKNRQDPALRKQVADLRGKLAALQKELVPVSKYKRPPTQKSCGYSSCTPVSDGKNVWVLFGNGVAACYDLDGTRKWIRWIEKPLNRSNWGHSAGPALADGKVLVHLFDLVALDKDTGKELWRVKTPAPWGTPVTAQVGKMTVVITPNGWIGRASDGKPLAKNVSRLTYGSPIVHDGVAYFIQSGGRAVQLSPGENETVSVKSLWTTRPKNDRYYASPVLHEGLLYAIDQKTHFSVIDAKNGKVVYEKRLNFGRGGQTYPSVAFAGGYIFLSRQCGATVVMKPGRKPEPIAENKLEMFRSSPVFAGKRMYIRTLQHLYCIGK